MWAAENSRAVGAGDVPEGLSAIAGTPRQYLNRLRSAY